jgi:hypothetical protein
MALDVFLKQRLCRAAWVQTNSSRSGLGFFLAISFDPCCRQSFQAPYNVDKLVYFLRFPLWKDFEIAS